MARSTDLLEFLNLLLLHSSVINGQNFHCFFGLKAIFVNPHNDLGGWMRNAQSSEMSLSLYHMSKNITLDQIKKQYRKLAYQIVFPKWLEPCSAPTADHIQNNTQAQETSQKSCAKVTQCQSPKKGRAYQ